MIAVILAAVAFFFLSIKFHRSIHHLGEAAVWRTCNSRGTHGQCFGGANFIVAVCFSRREFSEMSTELPDNVIIELIRLVEERPALWELQSADYRNIHKKRAMWQEIAAHIKRTFPTLEKVDGGQYRDCISSMMLFKITTIILSRKLIFLLTHYSTHLYAT